MKNALSLIIAAIAAMLVAAPAPAVPTPSVVPAPAPTIYRLNGDASYQQGCFPPCLCPIMVAQNVRGTFMLTAIPIDPSTLPPAGFIMQSFNVTDVNWTVSLSDSELRITGSGTLTFISGIINQDPTMQLQLDLQVGDQPTQHFDSGQVAGSTLPDINLAISINGMFCFDTAIVVSASPVPASQILRYSLAGDSSFQQGCFDPCDCLLMVPQPMRGRFALVPLQTIGGMAEYAVVDAQWSVLSPSAVASTQIHGFGVYRRSVVGPTAIPPLQRLSMDLTFGAGSTTHFDSGLVAPRVPFPRIDATISVHGMVCFDTVLHVVARPLFIWPTATPPLGTSH